MVGNGADETSQVLLFVRSHQHKRRAETSARLLTANDWIKSLEPGRREPGTARTGHENDRRDAGLGKDYIRFDLGVPAA